jgi:hemerythrin superfamily protein
MHFATRKKTLNEIHPYTVQMLHRAEDTLRKHKTGVWSNDPKFIATAETNVQKWIRWRDLIAELIAELD